MGNLWRWIFIWFACSSKAQTHQNRWRRNLAQHKPCRAQNPSLWCPPAPISSRGSAWTKFHILNKNENSIFSIIQQPLPHCWAAKVCLPQLSFWGKKQKIAPSYESVVNSFPCLRFWGITEELPPQPGKRELCKAQRDRAATPGDLGAKGEEEMSSKSHPCLYKLKD